MLLLVLGIPQLALLVSFNTDPTFVTNTFFKALSHLFPTKTLNDIHVNMLFNWFGLELSVDALREREIVGQWKDHSHEGRRASMYQGKADDVA